MAEVYGEVEFAPKSLIKGEDIGAGQVGVRNLNAPFFLELRLIKTHKHTGVDSQKLSAESTPDMVRGFEPSQRIEQGYAIWSGSSAVAGSLTLTFGTAFRRAPIVIAVCAENDDKIFVSTGVPTATGITLRWRDSTGAGHTSVRIAYLVIGT